MSRGPVVFFHAHPDDEAIFTGGTTALLAGEGPRPLIVLATSGEAGLTPNGEEPGTDGSRTAEHRRREAVEAAEALGAEVEFLGYPDSGMHGEHRHGFAHQAVAPAAERLAGVLHRAGASALVIYDEFGIYGHPDHLQVHTVGLAAAKRAGIESVYLSTVDREYLHFVETHLVVSAGVPDRPPNLGLAATNLGMPTVLIDTAIDVRSALDPKRRAMGAHASQIPADGFTMQLTDESFSAVYGWEWYCRLGEPGAIDRLTGR